MPLEVKIWFVNYLLPMLIAHPIGKRLAHNRSFMFGIVFFHLMLFISIILSITLAKQYTLPLLSFELNGFAYAYGAWLVVSSFWLKRIGFFYSISSLLQEGAMLVPAFFLLPILHPLGVITLIAIPYIWAHNWDGWLNIKMLLVALWGVFIMGIFVMFEAFWLNVLLHTIVGTCALYAGVILKRVGRRHSN